MRLYSHDFIFYFLIFILLLNVLKRYNDKNKTYNYKFRQNIKQKSGFEKHLQLSNWTF